MCSRILPPSPVLQLEQPHSPSKEIVVPKPSEDDDAEVQGEEVAACTKWSQAQGAGEFCGDAGMEGHEAALQAGLNQEGKGPGCCVSS